METLQLLPDAREEEEIELVKKVDHSIEDIEIEKSASTSTTICDRTNIDLNKGLSRDSRVDKHYDANSGRTCKRDRSQSSESASSSSKSSHESPRPRHNTKLSSVLIHPSTTQQRQRTSAKEFKREIALESQRNDKQTLDRNKRMFGMLMGTLKQFKVEESGRGRSATTKRSRIEEEKCKLERDHEDAFNGAVRNSRDDRQKEAKRNFTKIQSDDRDAAEGEDEDNLKSELDIKNRFKSWESMHRNYYNFIQTEAKPKIFWSPKEHTPATEKRLRETKNYFSICVAERAAKLKKELGELITIKDSVNTRQSMVEDIKTTEKIEE